MGVGSVMYSNKKDDENILKMYLKEINKIPLLKRDEEDKFVRLALAGDNFAREKVLNGNLRFVVSVAKKYQNQGLPLSDLISEGNIGLMSALDRFDPDRGYHFISYAVWWIRQSVLKAINEKSRMIRLPLNRTNELVQIEKTRKELNLDKYDDESNLLIATELGMKKSHVENLLNISRDLVSLETPIDSKSDKVELRDLIEDGNASLPEENLVTQALKDDINDVLDSLTEKESQIIQYRFGLNGNTPMSLKDISLIYDLTKERIRQIEKKALTRIRQNPQMQLKNYIA